MPSLKRQKLSAHSLHEQHDDDRHSSSEESLSDANSDDNSSDEIVDIKRQKSHQTSKRKIRATGSSIFGATLQSLLHTDAPSELPLSLKPSIARQRNDEKLESRARKVLQVEKKEREDKGRIRDVIGGWGGENERALRKVAQRGVVKLFNAIQNSQTVASVSAEEAKNARGTGKPTLPAPAIDDLKKKKVKHKNNTGVARPNEGKIEKDDFFDMIRSGGVVSNL